MNRFSLGVFQEIKLILPIDVHVPPFLYRKLTSFPTYIFSKKIRRKTLPAGTVDIICWYTKLYLYQEIELTLGVLKELHCQVELSEKIIPLIATQTFCNITISNQLNGKYWIRACSTRIALLFNQHNFYKKKLLCTIFRWIHLI